MWRFLGIHAECPPTGLLRAERPRERGVRFCGSWDGLPIRPTFHSFGGPTASDRWPRQLQAAGLLAAYVEQVPADEPPSLAVEMPMEAPLVDPATGEDLGLPMVGITDLVLKTAEGPMRSSQVAAMLGISVAIVRNSAPKNWRTGRLCAICSVA